MFVSSVGAAAPGGNMLRTLGSTTVTEAGVRSETAGVRTTNQNELRSCDVSLHHGGVAQILSPSHLGSRATKSGVGGLAP